MNQTPIVVISRPPKFSEVSGLLSSREEDSPRRAWRKHQQLSSVARDQTQAIEGLQRQLNALRKRTYGADFEEVRLFLCDSVTGLGAYYLVAARLDPDQTPAAA